MLQGSVDMSGICPENSFRPKEFIALRNSREIKYNALSRIVIITHLLVLGSFKCMAFHRLAILRIKVHKIGNINYGQ